MESKEAGGESGHMIRLSSIKKKKSADTFSDICPAPWETVGYRHGDACTSEGVFQGKEGQTFALMIMYKKDDQTQTPPLIGHVILSE